MVGPWTVLLCGQNVQRNFWRRLPIWPVHLLLENFSNETILILESSVNRGQDNGEPIVEEGETMIISSLSVLESKSWFLSSTACYSQNTRDGRPAPRGRRVPRPAPPCKNDQNRREVAGQDKGPNLNFLQMRKPITMEQSYNTEQCPIQPVNRICKRK